MIALGGGWKCVRARRRPAAAERFDVGDWSFDGDGSQAVPSIVFSVLRHE